MHAAGPKNPLHGITLEKMVTQLQEFYGWDMLGQIIKINSFNWQPSIKSSLVFLRKTPWARAKVEELYIDTLPDIKAKEAGADPLNNPSPDRVPDFDAVSPASTNEAATEAEPSTTPTSPPTSPPASDPSPSDLPASAEEQP